MKKFLSILALLIIAFVIFVATRSNTYHIERSASIAASNDAVFARINDFHEWAAWSPWEKLDPTMQKTFDGAPSGVGAAYHWVGNKDVGEGRMTITESVAPGKVAIKLEFLKPWQETCLSTFALAPEGPGTRVTWSMDGNKGFMAKAMCLFVSMDSMVGPDFERGLGALRSLAEAGALDTLGAAVITPGRTSG